MGNCASNKKPKNRAGSAHPHRKYSVYFPSQTAGIQKYAERECKASGLNFKDIQEIYNNHTNNNNNNNHQESPLEIINEQESTHIQGSRISAINQANGRFHYTAKLKNGDTHEDYPINKDTFKNFDFTRSAEEEDVQSQ